jgi:two-component system response regulator DesR
MNLLIVEDNQPMRELIKSLLEDIAELINECADGADAFAAYSLHRPDWVLMDIKMNGLDGISATREIKNAFPDARIMIVSDYTDAKIRDDAQRAGACEYVNKETLLDVRRILTAS